MSKTYVSRLKPVKSQSAVLLIVVYPDMHPFGTFQSSPQGVGLSYHIHFHPVPAFHWMKLSHTPTNDLGDLNNKSKVVKFVGVDIATVADFVERN